MVVLCNSTIIFGADSSNLSFSDFIDKFESLSGYDKSISYSIDQFKDYVETNYLGSIDMDEVLSRIDTIRTQQNISSYPIFYYTKFEPNDTYIYIRAYICDSNYPIVNYNNYFLYGKYISIGFNKNTNSYTNLYPSTPSGNFIGNFNYNNLYFPTDSFFYDANENKYINSYGAEAWTIINIAYSNTRAANTYMTDTGYNLQNDLVDSIYWDSANTLDTDTNIAGKSRDGYFFTETPHFSVSYWGDPLDLSSYQWHVEPINWSRYRSGTYYDNSRGGNYSSTPLLYPDTNWKAYRDSTGLIIDKSVPLVLREGAMLTDITNKKIYVNDKSLPIDNTPLIVPVDNIYNLLQSWLKFDIKSWASIYIALNGIQAQINSIQDLIAASYFQLSGFTSPFTGSYWESLNNYITGMAESIGMQYTWTDNHVTFYDQLSLADTLNHFYRMTHTFNQTGSELAPTYNYKNQTYTNSIYWIYRDIANISNQTNYIAQGIDQILDKMDELFVTIPGTNDTIKDTIGNDQDLISLDSEKIQSAHSSLTDILSWFHLEGFSGSFDEIFGDPDHWSLWSEETYQNCGLDVEE